MDRKCVFLIESYLKKVDQNTHINGYLLSLQGGWFAEGPDGHKDSVWQSWE